MQLPVHLRRFRERVNSLRSNSVPPEVKRAESPAPAKQKIRKEKDKKKAKRSSSVPAHGDDDDFRCRGYRATKYFDSYDYYQQQAINVNITSNYQYATMNQPRGRKLSVPEIINRFPQPPHRVVDSSQSTPLSRHDYFRPTLPIRQSPDLKPSRRLPHPLVPVRRPVTPDEEELQVDLAFADWYERVVRKEQDDFFRAAVPALAQRKTSSNHSNSSTASLHSDGERQARPLAHLKRGPPVASSANHSIKLQSAPARPLKDSRSRKLSNSSSCSERSRIAIASFGRLFTPRKKTPAA